MYSSVTVTVYMFNCRVLLELHKLLMQLFLVCFNLLTSWFRIIVLLHQVVSRLKVFFFVDSKKCRPVNVKLSLIISPPTPLKRDWRLGRHYVGFLPNVVLCIIDKEKEELCFCFWNYIQDCYNLVLLLPIFPLFNNHLTFGCCSCFKFWIIMFHFNWFDQLD